jgi:hypothetical protein
MQSLVIRSIGVLAGAGIAATMAAAPAAAAGPTFDLSTRSATARGSYHVMMGLPERPIPPIQVRGTLVVTKRNWCGVVQIAYNGPADGIQWRTVGKLCGRSRTTFVARSGYLWGGAAPGLRLCSGRTVERAERSRQCDVHRPPVDH